MRRALLLLTIVAGGSVLVRRLAEWIRERIEALLERVTSAMQQKMAGMMEEMPEGCPT
jgi:ribose 1,5-bisphosphokinase PhnN